MTSLLFWRLRYNREWFIERAQMWVAWHLPAWLVKWTAIRMFAHATTGQYGNDHPGDVSIVDALNRWDKSMTSNKDECRKR